MKPRPKEVTTRSPLLAVGHRLVGDRVDDLFEVVVLDDVRAAGLVLALEHDDRADLGHAGGVGGLGAPLLFDQRLGGGDRAGRLAGEDQPLDGPTGEVDAQRRGLLGHAQGVGRGRADDGRAGVDDLAHARLGGHVAAGQRQAAELLGGVVRAPEADERAVAEGEEDGVGRAHAEAPEGVAPHLGDPLPVLGAVEHGERPAAAGARGGVVAHRRLARLGQDRAERRVVLLALHPLVAGQERDLAQVVEALHRLGRDARGAQAIALPGRGVQRVGHELLQLAQLEGLERHAIERLAARVPVRRLHPVPFDVRGGPGQ